MKIVLAILLLSLSAFYSPRAARAEVVNDVFQVLCMPELGAIEINELDANGEIARRSIKEKREQLERRYGIYVPQWHLLTDGGADEQGLNVEPTRIACALRGAAVEVTLLPERLPNGRYSISVTLSDGGRVLIDDVPFTLCDIGGPITSILYNAPEEYVVFEGQFGGDDPAPPEPRLAGFETGQTEIWYFLGNHPIVSYGIRYLGSDYNHPAGTRLEKCRPRLKGDVMPDSRHKWFWGFE